MTKARDLASAAPAPSTVSATEIGYLDGVSSAIQTQIDGKSGTSHNHNSDYIAKTLTTTTGDIIYASSANTPARLGIGSTSQVLTVSGGIPAWASPATSGFVGASVSHSGTVSASNDTWTIMPMDTEAFDTNNFHSTSTNNSRITIPAGLAGKYLVVCRLRWDQSASGARNTSVYKNGSLLGWVNYAPSPTWGGGGSWPSTPWVSILNLSVGDYLEAAGMQQSGGTLNGLSTWEFSVQYLGA